MTTLDSNIRETILNHLSGKRTYIDEYHLICLKQSTLPKRCRDYIVEEIEIDIDIELKAFIKEQTYFKTINRIVEKKIISDRIGLIGVNSEAMRALHIEDHIHYDIVSLSDNNSIINEELIKNVIHERGIIIIGKNNVVINPDLPPGIHELTGNDIFNFSIGRHLEKLAIDDNFQKTFEFTRMHVEEPDYTLFNTYPKIGEVNRSKSKRKKKKKK